MFVLIEKESSKTEPGGRIIEERTKALGECYETVNQATDAMNNRMLHISSCYQDYAKISDTKCKYTYVGMESYSEFSIARIEIVSPEENLDV